MGLKSKNRTALAARAKLELARTAQTVNKEHKRGLSMKTHILPQVGAPSPSSHSRYHARSNIFTGHVAKSGNLYGCPHDPAFFSIIEI